MSLSRDSTAVLLVGVTFGLRNGGGSGVGRSGIGQPGVSTNLEVEKPGELGEEAGTGSRKSDL